MRTKIFLVSLSIVALAACQSKPPAEKPAADPAAPTAEAPAGPTAKAPEAPAPVPGAPSALAGKVIPASVDWFGAVDPSALKGTVLERQFRPWLGYLDTIPKYKPLMEETGAGELLGHTLLFGGTFAPQTPIGFDAAGAVFGLKDAAKMSGWISARLEEKGGPPGMELKTGHQDGGMAWVAGPTLTAKVEELLAGKGESVNDDAAWVELQRAINTKAPLWAMVRIPELVRAQFPFLHSEIPGLRFFPGATEVLGMTHAALSLDFGDRLGVQAAIRLQSAEDAAVVLEQLELFAEATLWDPRLFFDVFQLRTAGPLVTLHAATSKKAWRITVFWLSIAAQAAAYEELHVDRWEKEMMKTEKKEARVKEVPMGVPVEAEEIPAQ
jgi:hypothetical protein